MTEQAIGSSDLIIIFSNQDTVDIQFPHCDTLVISTQVSNSLVRRVMVDAGTNVDDIFWDTLQQLKVDKKLVKPSRALLTEFEGTKT